MASGSGMTVRLAGCSRVADQVNACTDSGTTLSRVLMARLGAQYDSEAPHSSTRVWHSRSGAAWSAYYARPRSGHGNRPAPLVSCWFSPGGRMGTTNRPAASDRTVASVVSDQVACSTSPSSQFSGTANARHRRAVIGADPSHVHREHLAFSNRPCRARQVPRHRASTTAWAASSVGWPAYSVGHDSKTIPSSQSATCTSSALAEFVSCPSLWPAFGLNTRAAGCRRSAHVEATSALGLRSFGPWQGRHPLSPFADQPADGPDDRVISVGPGVDPMQTRACEPASRGFRRCGP